MQKVRVIWMSNSSLATYVKLSPHCVKRTKPITKITIHHMAGNLSVETCGNVFQGSRKASSNYGIGTDGRIGLYVEESSRSYASSSADNDQVAVTIEVSNCSGEPDWKVSDKAYESLINLCVDICQRNGIKQLIWTGDKKGNLTIHKMFKATACPGPFLESRMPIIASEVNARLNSQKAQIEPKTEKTVISTPKTTEAVEKAQSKAEGCSNGKEKKVIAKSGLNMRVGAGTGKKIVATIPFKAKVVWYGYYSIINGNKWLLIKYGNREGYCLSKYLQ